MKLLAAFAAGAVVALLYVFLRLSSTPETALDEDGIQGADPWTLRAAA